MVGFFNVMQRQPLAIAATQLLRWRSTWHGHLPGTGAHDHEPILLPSGETVQSEEDSASCGALVDLVQSLIAIFSVKYAFLSNLPLR